MHKSKGIRILDKIGRTVSVELTDILEEIRNGNFLNWSILELYGVGKISDSFSLEVFEEQVLKSKNGYFINGPFKREMRHLT